MDSKQSKTGIRDKNENDKEDNNHGWISRCCNCKTSSSTNPRSSKEKSKTKPVSFCQLYRFTTCPDKLSLLGAVLATVIASISLPAINILFSTMESQMISQGKDPVTLCPKPPNTTNQTNSTQPSPFQSLSDDEFLLLMGEYSLTMVGCGILQLIAGYFFVSIFRRVAQRQIYHVRTLYLRALLRQDIGWYDTVEDTNFISRISANLSKVETATGDKVGMFLYYILTSLFSLVISLWYGWYLTLIVLTTTPVVLITSVTMSVLQSRFAMQEEHRSAVSGKLSEEVLSNVRTVKVFSGQEKEIERYERGLAHAMSAAKKRSFVSAFGNGILWVVNYGSYALAFWYGTKLVFEGRTSTCGTGQQVVTEPEYTPKNLLVVFYSVLVLSFNLVEALSLLEFFSIGKAAAATIYEVIDRTPDIDCFSEEGARPSERPRGKLEFRDVQFAYPSRSDVQILHGLNLTINPGTTVAFVGSSGCGKSTTLQLLQRFYDPNSGAILLDDMDIRDLNITWYRSQLGVVSQEPALFSTSIADNIRYGQDGVTQDEIEEACRASNAHSFISRLPQTYDTLVGDRGAQLSGGQKQRIAIARALVRNPSVLILDEATSALDTRNESIVQHALDKARQGRTTLIVAHRLSTIRTADMIVSIQNGKVLEIGTHKELLEKKGLYFHLVTAQMGEGDSNFGAIDHSRFEEMPIKFESKLTSTSLEAPDSLINSIIMSEESIVENLSGPKENLNAEKCTAFRIMKLNKPECPLLLLGILFSIAHGTSLPAYAFFFGDFMGVFSIPDLKQAEKEVDYYAILFLLTGIIAGGTIFVASICLSFAGENLTKRLRHRMFRKLLYQDVSWFDLPENSIGAVCTRLTGDTASIQGASGSRLGIIFQSVATIGVATGISLHILPKLGVIALICVPTIMVIAFICDHIIQKQQKEEKQAFEEASKLTFQAVTNIRTVASLCKERAFVEMYSEALFEPHKKSLRNSHVHGLVYGLGESTVYCAYAAVYFFGSYLIVREKAEAEKLRNTVCDWHDGNSIGEAMLWSMLMIGKSLAFGPSYNIGKVSGARIINFLESKQGISTLANDAGLPLESFKGNIKFENVEFCYPSRPEVRILKGLNAAIESYSKVGICGPSGSGKSTCLLLLQRFYDPTSGRVLLDEQDSIFLNVDSCLSQMALVSQEPALFDRTIAENIAYGDNSRELSREEIISAAQSANIHNFIISLPSDYDTRVGEMGAQLSGGQKQRVAIARALVRNPKLLLLDEATSALDMESERVVQDALDAASSGRTSVSIAHRLSSIQHADQILVINHGILVEQGTHQELLSKGGMYYTLWNMQSHGYTHQ